MPQGSRDGEVASEPLCDGYFWEVDRAQLQLTGSLMASVCKETDGWAQIRKLKHTSLMSSL